jgi:hypothetical protein
MSRCIPLTITAWANGPPLSQWRLPIDEELTRLVRRKRGPVIRNDSAVVAEFPSLNWDGPYRAIRYFLYHFGTFAPMHLLDITKIVIKKTGTQINLLNDIRKSIQAYLDELEKPYSLVLLDIAEPLQSEEWSESVSLLRKVAISKIGFMEETIRQVIESKKQEGRPPYLWKAEFVAGLANLWRVMTGEDASKDLASPFASFVAEAWASLEDGSTEISWASQIRRRKDDLPREELVTWANSIRHFALGLFEKDDKGEKDS